MNFPATSLSHPALPISPLLVHSSLQLACSLLLARFLPFQSSPSCLLMFSFRAMDILASTSVYGWIVGQVPSYFVIRTWLQASNILEVVMDMTGWSAGVPPQLVTIDNDYD